MENRLKFYLLAEESGWECQAYAFQYRHKIKDLNAYHILSYNIKEAKNHLSASAKDIVLQYENLNETPRTLAEAFVLEATVNYLAEHSFPEYYINPLEIDPNYNGDVTTIGDLMVNVNGENLSYNELIMNQEIPLNQKKEVVYETVSGYLTDMNDLVSTSLKIIQQRAFAKDEKTKNRGIFISILEGIWFVLIHVFFLFLLIYPFDSFWQCFYAPDFHYLLTYLSYLFPVTLFAYDVFFAIFHSYKANISEPYNYARRFLKSHSEKVYDDIKRQSNALIDYINNAIVNEQEMSEDIKKFSKLSSSYVDFKKVLTVSTLKKKTTYRVLNVLYHIFTTLIVLIGLLTVIAVLLSLLFRSRI